MTKTPVVLSPFARIFKRDTFCSLVHYQKGNISILHPSEAFLLSLLDGAMTEDNLTQVFSTTYGVPMKEAVVTVSTVMRKLAHFFISADDGGTYTRYDPLEFLFPGFDRQPNFDNPLSKPQMLGLTLTTHCNFRCRYCSMGSNRVFPQTMEKDTALRLIREAAGLGVVHLSFGGWEPLLYPAILDVVKAAFENEMALLFSTNGSLLTESMVKGLIDAGLKGIQVSIDAPTADLHHYMTDSHDTFDSVISGIKRLKGAGIWVKTRSVVTSSNLRSVPSLIEMLVDLGIDQITLGPQHKGACDIPCQNGEDMLDPVAMNSLREIVGLKTAEHREREIILGEPEASWQGPEDVTLCGHPMEGLMVTTNGDVLFCEFINDRNLAFGNVNMSTLDEIWLGPGHRRFLDMVLDKGTINEECGRCDMLEKCHSGCFNLSMIDSHNYFAKDPRCPGPEAMKG